MRDYLEELLAGTEDALDQAEAEWTEGVSPPLPRRSKERPEAAGGPAEPERSAGAEETARDGKNWIETEREGQSRSGETGACRPSGAESGETRGGGRDCAGDPGGGTRLPLGDRGGGGHPTAPGRHGTGPAGSGVPPGAQSRPGGAGLPSARIG